MLASANQAGVCRSATSRRCPDRADHLGEHDCYHDVMTRKATTVRLPEDLADTAEVVARARGTSVNQVILDALQAEIDRVREDEDFMALLHTLVERDKEILDRLAE
jgi:4-aminobutyrate aminotransferase-like enzyme